MYGHRDHYEGKDNDWENDERTYAKDKLYALIGKDSVISEILEVAEEELESSLVQELKGAKRNLEQLKNAIEPYSGHFDSPTDEKKYFDVMTKLHDTFKNIEKAANQRELDGLDSKDLRNIKTLLKVGIESTSERALRKH